MKHLIYFQSSLLLILFAGCTTPATKRLHKESMVRDPQIEAYHKAFESMDYVFLNYSVSEPTEANQKKVAESYWARIPKNELDDYRFKKWEVYRAESPPDLPVEEFTKIEILDLASYTKPTDRKFHNKDQFLTYIIDSHEYTPPVLFFDSGDPNVFHLVGTNMLHGSYRGLWNSPRGFYRDRGVVASNAVRYPAAAAKDVATAPIRAPFELMFSSWE